MRNHEVSPLWHNWGVSLGILWLTWARSRPWPILNTEWTNNTAHCCYCFWAYFHQTLDPYQSYCHLRYICLRCVWQIARVCISTYISGLFLSENKKLPKALSKENGPFTCSIFWTTMQQWSIFATTVTYQRCNYDAMKAANERKKHTS